MMNSKSVKYLLAILLLLGLVAAGCESEPTSGSGDPSTDPCAEIGSTLVVLELNDRCLESGENWDVERLGGVEVFEDSVCGVIIAALPEALLVVDDGTDVQVVLDTMKERLEGIDVGDPIQVENFESAFRVPLSGADLIDTFTSQLTALQGPGYSLDLNYLEPVQPNNGFRSEDDPQRVDGSVDEPSDAPDARIMVVDTTGNADVFDTDGNGYFDEDHGHGRFVQSLIDVSQAKAEGDLSTMLLPVTSRAPRLTSGRWAPMTFADSDLLSAIAGANASAEFVNLSLGGAGCWESGVGERIALARGMQQLLPDAVFVAAAGNQGADVRHYPAAWRADDAMVATIAALPEGSQERAELEQLKEFFAEDGRLFAVGSVDDLGAPDVPSVFSNCGDWVNAVALGTSQVGFYPNPPAELKEDGELDVGENAEWSGTSFATARVTAYLASGEQLDDVAKLVDNLGCS